MSVLLMGCVLCTGAGILRKEKELPFVPFLTAGYIAGRIFAVNQMEQKKRAFCAGSSVSGTDGLSSYGISGLFYAVCT